MHDDRGVPLDSLHDSQEDLGYNVRYDHDWIAKPFPFPPVSSSPYHFFSIPPATMPPVSTHQPPAPFWCHNGQHELFVGYEASPFHGAQTIHGLTPPESRRHVFLPPSQASQPTGLGNAPTAYVPQQDNPPISNPPNVSNLLDCAATGGASSAIPDNSSPTESNSANRLRTMSARDLFRNLPNGEVKGVVGKFLQSRWLCQNEMEPPIVTSQDAPGTSPSTSIYVLLVSDGPVKRCKLCGYQNERFDRILAHLRSHFNHRPYACNSSCGSRICLARFTSQRGYTEHIRPIKNCCTLCSKPITRKNLRRHLSQVHPDML